MAGNSFGTLFRITTFGESHGPAVGVVVDGCPSNIKLDLDFIQSEMDKRRPGQSKITTQRKETDTIQILSGVFEGKTTGAPLTIVITNEDQRSHDYAHLQNVYRPSHSDYTYDIKYGHRDYRGGGRSSARETAARVAAGAVAKLILKKIDVEIFAHVSSVGAIESSNLNTTNLQELIKSRESTIVRCADQSAANQMIDLIDEVRKAGDTIGGKIACIIRNCPPGLGDPVFDKLHADLGKGMLSINAVHGFEYGSGFAGSRMQGSQHNDLFEINQESTTHQYKTRSNFSGGIQGGISNGMDITFQIAFKPVATLMQKQISFNAVGEEVEIRGKGRHDPCVVPRAVAIVEAMTALVLADHYLRNKIYQHV